MVVEGFSVEGQDWARGAKLLPKAYMSDPTGQGGLQAQNTNDLPGNINIQYHTMWAPVRYIRVKRMLRPIYRQSV